MALFSGGKDSTSVAHHLWEQDRLDSCLHINTTIRTPDIDQHIEAVCQEFGWKLRVITTPYSYDRMVLKYGFPGYQQHGRSVNYLKGRALRLFRKEFPGAVLASGVRRYESARRFINTQEWSWLEGLPVHAPLMYWTNDQIWSYVKRNGIRRSPAYSKLHVSGDCMCGAYADPSEIHMIRMFYPELGDRIQGLEEQLDKSGAVKNKKYCRWGGLGGFKGAKDQRKMENFTPNPLCAECDLSTVGAQLAAKGG